jgi:hypothetical protein
MFRFFVWDCDSWHVLAEWVSFIGFIDSDPKTHIHYICNTPKHNLRAIKNALVICANTLTWWVDWDNQNSCILFGDGADAMVFTSSKGDGKDSSKKDDGFAILGYSMHSNANGGGGYRDLKCMQVETDVIGCKEFQLILNLTMTKLLTTTTRCSHQYQCYLYYTQILRRTKKSLHWVKVLLFTMAKKTLCP